MYKAQPDTHGTRKFQAGFAPASFHHRVHDVDLHHCTPALGCSYTSLRLCCCSNQPDKPGDHSALWQSWPTLCSFTHVGRTKKNKLCLHCSMPLHCSVLSDSKPSHGVSDPFMSPRAVHKQTHTDAHREQLCLFILVCVFIIIIILFTMVFSRSNFETSNPIISPCVLSEKEAFWRGIWAAAA